MQELNAEPVVPDGFPEWVTIMNGWGRKMIAAVEVCWINVACAVRFTPVCF